MNVSADLPVALDSGSILAPSTSEPAPEHDPYLDAIRPAALKVPPESKERLYIDEVFSVRNGILKSKGRFSAKDDIELTAQQAHRTSPAGPPVSFSGGRKYSKCCSRKCTISCALAVFGAISSAAGAISWMLLAFDKKIQKEYETELGIIAMAGMILSPLCFAWACLLRRPESRNAEEIPYQALSEPLS